MKNLRVLTFKIGDNREEWKVGGLDKEAMSNLPTLQSSNLSGKMLLLTHADPGDEYSYERAQQRLHEWSVKLRGVQAKPARNAAPKRVTESDFVSGFTQQGFEEAVGKAKEYITDGDIMQVVLSQRLSIPYSAAPLNIYRALRCLNPSPYMFFLNLGDFRYRRFVARNPGPSRR